jgi:hypothetical protein
VCVVRTQARQRLARASRASRNWTIRIGQLGSFVLCAVLLGCGPAQPERVGVKGKVLLDGIPLAEGGILFIPVEGTKGPKAGGVITDGMFEIDPREGPGVGKLLVQIVNDRPPEDAVPHGHGSAEGGPATGTSATEAPVPGTPVAGSQAPRVTIPRHYNQRSILYRETSATEDNYFEFDLKSQTPNP